MLKLSCSSAYETAEAVKEELFRKAMTMEYLKLRSVIQI